MQNYTFVKQNCQCKNNNKKWLRFYVYRKKRLDFRTENQNLKCYSSMKWNLCVNLSGIYADSDILV